MNIIATSRECVCDVSLHALSADMRRMLRVQFKEFIHFIDDHSNNNNCKFYDITDALEAKSNHIERMVG